MINNRITYNHLRLNTNKFYELNLYSNYQRAILNFMWTYIHNQYSLDEFENLTYKEQLDKLENNCYFAGYYKYVEN